MLWRSSYHNHPVPPPLNCCQTCHSVKCSPGRYNVKISVMENLLSSPAPPNLAIILINYHIHYIEQWNSMYRWISLTLTFNQPSGSEILNCSSTLSFMSRKNSTESASIYQVKKVLMFSSSFQKFLSDFSKSQVCQLSSVYSIHQLHFMYSYVTWKC